MKTSITTTTPSALTPTEIQEIVAVKTGIDELMQGIRSVPIESPAEIEAVGKFLTEYTEQARDLEKRRVSLTKPLNAMLDSINGVFNPTIKALKAATDSLRKVMSDAKTAIDTRNRLLVQQQAQLIAANQPHAAAIAHSGMAVAPVLEGIKTREVLKAEVTNADAVPLPYCSPDIRKIMYAVSAATFEVPRVLCSPDPEKIEAALKLLGDRLNIPGVTVTSASVFSVQTKKA